MQITRNDISETKVEFTVKAGLEELTHAKQSELKERAKTMKVAGFREGKAPLSVIEKQVDSNELQAKVINHTINDAYNKTIEDEKLRTFAQPEVEVKSFVPYTELEFTATVEIMPTIKLADYKKISKTVKKVAVTEKDVNEVLENLRARSATKTDTDKPAKDGDVVVIDFEGTDKDGQKVAGASGKDYSLSLGSKSFIPGFEEGLVGVKKGDKKELKLAFPKDYHADNLAGTKITFAVTVKNVQTLTKQKLDDAFAASIGPFKTMADLKKDIKTQLTGQKQQEADNIVKDEIVEALVTKTKISLPSILVEDQMKSLEHDFEQNLTYRGITKKEYLKKEGYKDEAEMREKEFTKKAEQRVATGMVLAEVAEKEAVQVSQEDVAERIALYKQQYPQDVAQFDQPDMRREIASRILTEKTVDKLFEIATKSK